MNEPQRLKTMTHSQLIERVLQLESAIEAVPEKIAEAVRAENEACAKIAIGYDVPCDPRTDAEQTAHNIAAAIRARQNQH